MIDSEIQQFVDGVAEAYARFPDVMTVSPQEARDIVEEVRRPWRQGGPEMASTEERRVALPTGEMRIRIYRPANAPAADSPAFLYLHGGGFTFFSIDTHDRLMREYAERAGLIVIGIDYPLAPETKFPVALDLIVELIDWLAETGATMGIDPDRLAIGGDSAGGNLSLAAAVSLRDMGRGDRLKGLVLNYPGISPEKSPEAIAKYNTDDAILSLDETEFFWNRYLRSPADRSDPLANLSLADMSGLPAMIFIIAEEDILAEEGIAAGARVTRAGGDAVVEVYAGAVHGFVEAVSISSIAARAIDDASVWLATRLDVSRRAAELAV